MKREPLAIPADQLESFLKEMHGRFLGTMNEVGKRYPNSSIVFSCDGGRGVIEALAKRFGLDVTVSERDWVNVYAPKRRKHPRS